MRLLLVIGWNESMTVETVTDISLVTVLISILIDIFFIFSQYLFTKNSICLKITIQMEVVCFCCFFIVKILKGHLKFYFLYVPYFPSANLGHLNICYERNGIHREMRRSVNLERIPLRPKAWVNRAHRMKRSPFQDGEMWMDCEKKTSAHLNYTRDRGMAFNIDTQMMLIFYLNAD